MSLIKYSLEFPIKTSISILFKRLSTPSGLSEWFADNVNIKNDVLTFFWEGSEEEATLISKLPNTSVKFKWDESDEDTYFEFKIQIDEITKDVSLIITDFCDEDEIEESKLLWESQINDLYKRIGG